MCEEETRPAAESLVLAGRRVLLAAGELQGRPRSPRHRERLAAAAQGLLAQTAKVQTAPRPWFPHGRLSKTRLECHLEK